MNMSGNGKVAGGLTWEARAIWLRLLRVAQRINRSGGADLATHGLSPAQFQVLVRVAAKPGAIQQELAATLDVTRGNISQLVTRLETVGLVRRTPDGTANRLHLTPAGAHVIGSLSGAYDGFVMRCLADLSPADGRTLVRLLRKVDDGIERNS
jgi:DNA-binding MarR family transcriptional regulator